MIPDGLAQNVERYGVLNGISGRPSDDFYLLIGWDSE